MRNLLGAGDIVRVIAPAAVTKDVGFLLGQILLIAQSSAASGAEVEAIVTGEAWVAKTSALAITAGDALYWDDAAKVVNKTSTAQKEVGAALQDAANPSGFVRMVLVPTIRTSVAA